MTMERSAFGSRARSRAAVAVLALLASPIAPLAAVAAGPFDGLSGVWAGNGTLTFSSGTKERLRCRVQYVQNNVNNLQQALRCASDSYRFDVNAYFDSDEGNISGVWQELTQEIRGTISGTVAGGRIDGALNGPGFVAQLLVVTNGDRQQVSIDAKLEEIESVAIEVRKASN